MKPFDAPREDPSPSFSDLFVKFWEIYSRESAPEMVLDLGRTTAVQECSLFFAFLVQQLRCSLRCFCARALFQFAEDFHLRLRFLRSP